MKISHGKTSRLSLPLNKSSTKRLKVSCKGILVKSDSTSKLAIIKLESWFKSSSTNGNESLIVYSFKVKGIKSGSKNLDSLYVGVPIANKIGQKEGTPSLICWWILAQPCTTQDLSQQDKDLDISFQNLSFCS